MAIRSFNGSSDHLDCAIGTYNPTGPHTLAVLIKRGANAAWHTPIAIDNSTGLTQVGLDIRGDNDQVAWCGNATVGNAGITELVADGWCIAAVTFTSAAAAPRIHLFKF